MNLKKQHLALLLSLLFGFSLISAQKIELENGTLSDGLKVEKCNEGGKSVGYVKDGSHIFIKNQTFDNSKKATVRISSINEGNIITLHQGSLESKPIGKAIIPKTGSWKTWADVSIKLKKRLSGDQDIYLKFSGNSKFLFNLNYIEFK